MSKISEEDTQNLPSNEKPSFKQKIGKPIFIILMAGGVLGFILGDFSGELSSRSPNNHIAIVGNKDISINDIQEAEQAILQKNRYLSPQLIALLRPKQRALENVINANLFSEYSHQFGLRADNDLVKKMLVKIPYFQDSVTGKFSKDLLTQYLDNRNLTEAKFIEKLKQDVLYNTTFDHIFLPIAPTKTMLNILHQYNNEARKVSFFQITADTIPDEALKGLDFTDKNTFFEENKNSPSFLRPEIRDISYLLFTPETLSKTLGVTDQNVKDFFNTHKERYINAEKRKVLQLFFKDEASALETYQKIDKNQKFIISASELGYALEDIDLGMITKGDGIPDNVFTLKKDQFSKPLKNDFGYAIYYIEEIEPAKKISFDTVAPLIRTSLEKKAFNNFKDEKIDLIEDDVAGGATLEEIADKYNLPLMTLESLTQKGNIFSQKEIIIDQEDFLTHFFSLSIDDEIGFSALENGFTYGRVTKISPKRPMHFEEAKIFLDEQYKIYRQEKSLRHAAMFFKKQLSDNPDIDNLAKSLGIQTKTVSLTRNISNDHFTQDDVTKIFAIHPQELKQEKPIFISDFTPNQSDKISIYQLNNIGTKTQINSNQKTELENKIQQNIAQDSYQAIIDDMKSYISIKIHQDTYNAYMGS